MKIKYTPRFRKFLATTKWKRTKRSRIIKKHLKKFYKTPRSLQDLLHDVYDELCFKSLMNSDKPLFALIPKEDNMGKFLP